MIQNINSKLQKPRISIRFSLVIIIFILWTLMQLIIPVKFLSFNLLSSLEIFKTMVPAFGIILSFFLYYDKLRFDHLPKPLIIFLFFISISTILEYMFFSSNIKIFATPIMHMLWIFAMFIVVPSVFSSLHKIRVFLRLIITTNIITLMIVLIFAVLVELKFEEIFKEDRLTLFYGNPLYLGAIFYSIFCCCSILLWMSNSKLEKLILILFINFSLIMLFFSFSRTFLLAALIGVIIFVYYNMKQFRDVFIVIFTTLLITFIIGIIYANLFMNIDLYTILNSISSNRLFIWNLGLENKLDSWGIFFGEGFSKVPELLQHEQAYKDGQVVSTFQRFNIDNTYIEIFLNYGILGLITFVWGIRNIFGTNILHKIKSIQEYYPLSGLYYLVFSILISIFFSALFYSHYPSLGNTINSAALPASLSILFLIQNHLSRNQEIQ